MNSAFILIAVSALGIDVGWKPLEGGGYEYIVQIAPDEVDRVVTLDDIAGDVQQYLDIRRYRITIGNEKLPRTKITTALKPLTDSGSDVGWEPLDDGGVEYIMQIEPKQVDRMVKSDDLVSDVPMGLDIRRYRITIGDRDLPRIASKPASVASAEQPASFEETSPSSPRKELVAEGSIPAELPKANESEAKTTPVETPEVTEPDSSTPAETAPSESPESTEEKDSEGPVLGSAQTTAQKPVAGSFREHDPEPQDEEGDESTAADLDRAGGSTRRAGLLSRSAVDESSKRLPARSTRYAGDETEESYDAQERPALSTAMRSSSASVRSSGNLNSDGPNETSWIVAIFFMLLMSAGLNMYLFWIAHEARLRYQSLLEKYRTEAGKQQVVEVV